MTDWGPSIKPEARRQWFSWALFAALMVATAAASAGMAVAERRAAEERLSLWADAVTTTLVDRMDAYAQVLRGASALFQDGFPVTRKRWRSYVESLGIDQIYPGIQGVGWARWIRPEDKIAREEAIRTEGFASYFIRPLGERSVYTAIEYIEPFRDRNLRAFGYDMYSEPVRREAMERALTTSSLALSGKVTLVQETERSPQTGCLLYYPVYRSDVPLATEADLRAALLGFAYSPFRMGDLLKSALDKRLGAVAVRLYDGEAIDSDRLFFDSQRAHQPLAGVEQRHALHIAGRPWTLVVSEVGPPGLIARYPMAALVAAAGTVLALLSLLLARSMTGTARLAEIKAQEATKRLAASELRTRAVVDQSPVGLFETDDHGHLLYANAACRQLLGLSPSEPLGVSWEHLIHPEDRDSISQEWSACVASERALHREMRLRPSTSMPGESIWVYATITPMKENGAAVGGHLGTLVDITPRKRAQDALRKSEERFALAVQGSSDGIWDWNLLTNEIWFSPRWKEQLGYADSELENSLAMWRSVIFPEDREEALRRVEAYNHGLRPTFEHVQRFRHKDGHTVYIHSRAIHHRDTAGHPVRMVGAHTDITRQMETEEKLRRQSARVRSMYEIATNPSLEPEAQLQAALALGLDWFGLEVGIVSEIVGDKYTVDTAISRGPPVVPGDTLPLSDTYCAATMASKDPVAFHHAAITEWSRHPGYRAGKQEVYLGSALTVGGRLFGTLSFSNRNPRALAFSADEHDMMRLLAQWVGTVLERRIAEAMVKKQQAELERLSVTDPLTRLGNRRHFENLMAPAWALALRKNRPVVLAVIDIDHFKRVNDTYGHDAGDLALQALAVAAQASLRQSDLICRWGGEEFVIALFEADRMQAAEVVERFRAAVSVAAPAVNGTPIALTVSAGAAIRQDGEDDWQQLLHRAGQALYRAKASGRNRLEFDRPIENMVPMRPVAAGR